MHASSHLVNQPKTSSKSQALKNKQVNQKENNIQNQPSLDIFFMPVGRLRFINFNSLGNIFIKFT
jgi:hypothetical protein